MVNNVAVEKGNLVYNSICLIFCGKTTEVGC